MNELTQEKFIIELKELIRKTVKGKIEFLSVNKRPNLTEHLVVLRDWYQTLSEKDREIFQMAMEYEAEGSLFMLLNVLDNVVSLRSSLHGEFKLYFEKDGSEIRLNSPEEDFLYDIFNNTP